MPVAPDEYSDALRDRALAAMEAEAEWHAEHPPRFLDDKPDPTAEREIEGFTHLEAMDALNDLINGVRHWKQTKLTAGSSWNTYDEALARWIDASELEWD